MTATTCDYCQRTAETCRRIPGACCGACVHTTPSALGAAERNRP